MQKRNWKRIALWTSGVFVGLTVILMVHIWWVMKPRIDAKTRVLARIDLHQRVDPSDAAKIKDWLYQQKGVKYVLVNPQAKIAVFSFAPIENDGNRIVKDFKAQAGYPDAVRYLPAVDPNASGCPVATTSVAYKAYAFMKRIL